MNIRRILFLLAGLALLAHGMLPAQSDWTWQNPRPQGNNLECVDPVTANVVFASGGAGTVLKSTNSGNSWVPTQIIDNDQVTLHAIHFPTVSIGWAAGTGGALMATSDGGSHWFVRNAPTRTLRGSASTGPNNGYVVGDAGTILRTRDGGVSWESVNVNTSQNLTAVFLANASIGYAVGDNGIILKTSDGGSNWIDISATSTTRDYKSVFFLTQDLGWVVGVGGTLMLTTDGGGTWSRQFTGTAQTLTSIVFTNANNGYALGGRVYLQTTNGGFSWGVAVPPLDSVNTLTQIAFADSMIGWIVGHNGEIRKTLNKGQSWARFADNTTFDLSATCFTSETRGWAVGDNGAILHTADGGTGWTRSASPVSTPLRSVHVLPNNQGIAVGDGGALLRTIDGVSWGQVATGSTQGLFAVHQPDPFHAWAVGERGAMLRSTDGGLSWQNAVRPASDTLLSFSSVQFIDASTGWVTANFGSSGDSTLILKTVDGGARWDTVRADSRALLAIQFVNADTGYAVGKFHYILKSTNGGLSWRPLINPVRSVNHFLGLSFVNANEGWVVGTNGNIIRTVDGGESWYLQPTTTGRSLSGVAFASNQKGWAVGVGGTILNTVNGGGDIPTPEPPPTTSGPNNHVLQAQPSPFLPSKNGVTSLPFRLSGQSDVRIRIFDVLGRLIRTLDVGVFGAGLHDMDSGAPTWNGLDDNGNAVPSGAYYFMVLTSEYVETQRLILLR